MDTKPIPLYKLAGDWFDMGRQLGAQIADGIRDFNRRYFSDAFNLMRFGTGSHLEKYAVRIGAEIREYSATADRFLAGLAQGADLPLGQVLMQAILPELTHVNSDRDWPAGACTAGCVAADRSATQGALIGQCWDFNVAPPPWFAARLSPPLGAPEVLLVGLGACFCCCGVNTAGLGVTFTASGHLPNVPPAVGVPIVVLLLETLLAEGYPEARDLVTAPKKGGSYNILLTDGYAQSALIEAAVARVDLIDHESILVCGNHFQHPGMIQATGQDLDPPEPPAREFARSSTARAERLRGLLHQAPKGAVGLDYLKTCLTDHENRPFSICAHEEKTILRFRTVGATILEPALRTIHLCPGQPCANGYEAFAL